MAAPRSFRPRVTWALVVGAVAVACGASSDLNVSQTGSGGSGMAPAVGGRGARSVGGFGQVETGGACTGSGGCRFGNCCSAPNSTCENGPLVCWCQNGMWNPCIVGVDNGGTASAGGWASATGGVCSASCAYANCCSVPNSTCWNGNLHCQCQNGMWTACTDATGGAPPIATGGRASDAGGAAMATGGTSGTCGPAGAPCSPGTTCTGPGYVCKCSSAGTYVCSGPAGGAPSTGGTSSGGVPSGGEATGGARGTGGCDVVVALTPGWAVAHDPRVSYQTIESDWPSYGLCPVKFVDIRHEFSLATIVEVGAHTLWIPDPSGVSDQYSAAEFQAVGDWVKGGYGGVVATYLLRGANTSGVADNGPLFVHFGIDEAAVGMGATAASMWVTRLASHPIVADLPEPFTLSGYTGAQAATPDWPSALLSGTTVVASSKDGKSVVVTRDTPARSVYISAFPEYQGDASARQLIYNAAMWTAGRDVW